MPAPRTLFALLGTLALSACGQSSDPIIIGLAAPLSDPVGRAMRLGAELAVSEINDGGGVQGRRIEILPFDDLGQAKTAVQVAERFRENDAVVAVIGHAGNTTTLAAASVYGSGEKPVVAVSPTASSPELSRAGPYVFRVCPDEVAHAIALAEWARGELGLLNAATLYENDSDSRRTATAFGVNFTELGGRILAKDPFSHAALPSFEPYLTRAAYRGNMQALLVVGGGSNIQRILATLDTVDLGPIVLGNRELLGFLTPGSEALDGSFLSTAYLADHGGTRNESFSMAYRQTHGGQTPGPAAAGSYDSVFLIARAIASRGATRVGIHEFLSGLGTEFDAFEGATGAIAFDKNGDLIRKRVEVGIVQAGILVSASER